MQTQPVVHNAHPQHIPSSAIMMDIPAEKPAPTLAPAALSMDARSIIAFDVYSGVLMGGGF